MKWLYYCPDPLESFKAGGDHVAVLGLAKAERREVRHRDTVGVLIDEESAACTVHRAIQMTGRPA